jgi:hypothetical protein
MNSYLVEVTNHLEKLGKYGSLVKKLRDSNMRNMPFVFEALFAYCFESNGMSLDYEKNLNSNNDSGVDFYFQKGDYEFGFELLRPEMKDELKAEYLRIDDNSLFGVELTQDHDKEYLRPEAQTIYLQDKLLEKVYKFPSPTTIFFSIIVIDCSNIHFGHFGDEDCRMVMYGKTTNPLWQEKWLHKHQKSRILGLLEKENNKRNARDFREKITGVVFVPEISINLFKRAYVSLNFHRCSSYRENFKNVFLAMKPFQNLCWV